VPRQLLDGHRRGGMGGLRPVAACSPTLVSIMATSCLANVGLRGGRVALIPDRVILRRRGCLASRKASPRSGVGGQPCFDVTRPRACCDGDHYADNAGLAMGRRHRGEVCYPTISLTSSGFELSPRRTTSGNSSELRPATCGVLEVVSVEGFLTYLSERSDGTRDWVVILEAWRQAYGTTAPTSTMGSRAAGCAVRRVGHPERPDKTLSRKLGNSFSECEGRSYGGRRLYLQRSGSGLY
jgi:hypothetical protein